MHRQVLDQLGDLILQSFNLLLRLNVHKSRPRRLGLWEIVCISAKKLKSKTAHFRIEIVNSDEKYMMNENSTYIGRLRASASLHDF